MSVMMRKMMKLSIPKTQTRFDGKGSVVMRKRGEPIKKLQRLHLIGTLIVFKRREK